MRPGNRLRRTSYTERATENRERSTGNGLQETGYGKRATGTSCRDLTTENWIRVWTYIINLLCDSVIGYFRIAEEHMCQARILYMCNVDVAHGIICSTIPYAILYSL